MGCVYRAYKCCVQIVSFVLNMPFYYFLCMYILAVSEWFVVMITSSETRGI